MAHPTPHERSKKYLYRYLVGILVLAAFGLGLFVGQGRFILRPSSTAFRGDPDLKGLWIETRESARKDVPFQLYWDIWDRVKQKYVGGEVDDLKLFYGSLAGMVEGLGDPYSSFLTPSTTEAFLSDLSGSFEGIGAEIGIKDGELTVIAPLPDSPAERAGIKAGDAILEIDDKDTSDVSLDAAVNLIRGPRGTKVTLTIRRNGFETEDKLTITRDIIDIKSVEWKLLDAGVGYIKINQFNEETWPEFNRAVVGLRGRDMKALVLDLRNNPGGFLETSVQVSSEWLPDGATVVIERTRDKSERLYTSEGSHRLRGLPTAVIVNEGSASASEIVAGALQDHKAATVVGQQSFGKGTVQDFEILEDGSALKLTISEWLTPNKQQINKHGITPDVIFEEAEDADITGGADDLVIKKALELLRKKE